MFHTGPLILLRHLAVCLSVPAVLKLLKMAVGMRALLDTVMQALPQVQCSATLFNYLRHVLPLSHPRIYLKEMFPVRASMFSCVFSH